MFLESEFSETRGRAKNAVQGTRNLPLLMHVLSHACGHMAEIGIRNADDRFPCLFFSFESLIQDVKSVAIC